jgi:hypothetical protein
MLMAFLQQANHQKSPQQQVPGMVSFSDPNVISAVFFLIFVDFISDGSGLALEIRSGSIRDNKCRSKSEHRPQNRQKIAREMFMNDP